MPGPGDLNATFTLPCTDDMTIGRGINILTGLVAYGSPFSASIADDLVALSTLPASSSYAYNSIRTEEERKRSIEDSLEASGAYDGVTVSASVKNLSEVTVSDTKMCTTVIAEFRYEPQMLMHVPTFTPEAKALLHDNPVKFAEQFGDYFVSGYTCASSMEAVAISTGHDKSTLDKFEASIKVGLPAPVPQDSKDAKVPAGTKAPSPLPSGSASAATSITTSAKELGISTNISISYMGVNGPAPGADSFEAILEVYDDWVTKIVPRKIIAHLTSYRSVDPLPPVPSLAPVLAPYAEQMNKMLNIVLTSPYHEFHKYKEDHLVDLGETLSNLDSTDAGALAAFKARIDAAELEVKRMGIRRDLTAKLTAMDSDPSQWGPGSDNIDRSITYGFTNELLYNHPDFGYMVRDSPPEVTFDSFVCEHSYSGNMHEGGNMTATAGASHRYIGYFVHDIWGDGSNNGHLNVQCANKDKIDVKIKSSLYRGCHWTMFAWKISTDLFYFD